MSVSLAELNKRQPMLARAMRAKDRLAQLSKSDTFRQKYLAGDPEAVAQYNNLVTAHAEGASMARDVYYGGSTEVDMGAFMAQQERVATLTQDPDFVQRYLAGDPQARAAWNNASTEGAAEALGVDAGPAADGAGS
jgi:hypothetical protein